jgi:hypothetical protein
VNIFGEKQSAIVAKNTAIYAREILIALNIGQLKTQMPTEEK